MMTITYENEEGEEVSVQLPSRKVVALLSKPPRPT